MSAFDKIIGYELIKQELRQLADCLKNTNKYRTRGVSIPRGLLLEGDPGVGKTSMTMCLVAESGRRAFICRKDTHDGDFVEHIREVFEERGQQTLDSREFKQWFEDNREWLEPYANWCLRFTVYSLQMNTSADSEGLARKSSVNCKPSTVN